MATTIWTWAIAIAIFFFAARPYGSFTSRLVSGGLTWGFLYGVIGTIMSAGPITDVPWRSLVGLVGMCAGLAVLETIFGLKLRRRTSAV